MKKFNLTLLLIFTFGVTLVMGQGRTVSGKVTDSGTGEPIIGASVIVVGTQNGAYTLEGGEFIIANVEAAVNLEVAFMGYSENTVVVAASQTNVNIKLTPSAMQMDEVVVVAYGTADKKSLTGSVAVISSDKIESRPISNVASAISGMSPGIIATVAGGEGGSSPDIRIRGIGSINSSSSPLYVVDGAIFLGDISNLSSDDIQSISVLKDAASTALYGSRASNGVVMIQTKSGISGRVSFNVKITQGIMYKALAEYERLEAIDWYGMVWESERNRQHYANRNDLKLAGELASDLMFSQNGNKYYNILTDNSAGTKMNDENVIIPTSWEGHKNPEWTRGVVNPNARVMDGYADDLNWMDELSRIGYRQNYTVSASGGNEKTSYFTSVGYLDEKSYLINTSYNRLNARAKVDVKPVKWLKLGTNIAVTMSEADDPYDDARSASNAFYTARRMEPIYPVHYHDMFTGKYVVDSSQKNNPYDMGQGLVDPTTGSVIALPRGGQYVGDNLLYDGLHNEESDQDLNLQLQAYAEIKFLNDFKFTIDGVMNNEYSYSDYFWNPNYGGGINYGGRASNRASTIFDKNIKQMLEWNRSFGKHSVDILLGHEYFHRERKILSATKTGEIFPGSTELDNFATVQSVVGYSQEYISEGFFARANYNFDEKYYFSASYRRDGSSKFAPQNRWGNFWSAGGTWILSSEDFMSNVMWVDFLKVRASYGTNGNDGGLGYNSSGNMYVGYYAWQSTYESSNYNGDSALQMGTVGNSELKWETAGALDLGIDFRLFNKLNGSIGYFNKSSNELIFNVPTVRSSGIVETTMNVGSMTNRGVEMSFDVDVIRKKDWIWNVGLNMSWIQNKIKSLPDGTSEDGIAYGNNKRLMPGHSIYEWYLPQFGGIDSEDGASYYHLDPESVKDGTEFKIDDKWYTSNIGNALKDFSGDGMSPISGAVTTSLTWKSITLDALFTYRIGGKAYDSTYDYNMSGSTDNSMGRDMLNSWRKPGDITSLPRIENDNINLSSLSDHKLISNSYVALQNVTLSYKFSKKIANKLALSGLSIYCSAENLFQISALKGYDALSSFEGYTSGDRFGSAATISFGINVSF